MTIKVAVLFGIIATWANGAPLQQVTDGNNVFTAALYKELMTTNQGNILVSPFSIEVILALTENGAKDQTAEEIRSSLYLPDNDDAIQKMFQRVLPILKSDANFTLNTANKIYIKDSLTLQQQFKRVAREVYQAEAETIDFNQNVEAADMINKWVEEQTENKIQDLISSDTIDPSTAIILINALHFKGQWAQGFNSQRTAKKPFYQSTKTFVEIETMSSGPLYRDYYEDEELEAQFLEMPFWGENISMVIALPRENEGIATLEEQIEKVFAPHVFRKEFSDVEIPKFRVESTIGLKDVLQNLGVKRAFNAMEADLTGIINEDAVLYITDVQQKAFIDVDEKGVEAAAASFEEIGIMAAPTVEFKVNRPFIFYIKYKDLILFAGRVNTP